MSLWIKRLYHFLGGVFCAIMLIALTAIFVVIGTFVESHTGSHQFADQSVYGTFFFSFLLWGFFINILIAALRRWPFKKKHIPFLITHLGLLMILGGALVKHYAGTQGAMFLLEGSATDQLMLPGSQALRIDSIASQAPVYLPLPLASNPLRMQDLEVTTLQCFPHCSERLDTFIKGDWVVINGVPPFPIDTSTQAAIAGTEWTLLAKRASSIKSEVRSYYRDHATLTLTHRSSGAVLQEIPLGQALAGTTTTAGTTLTADLEMDYSPICAISAPRLKLLIGGLPIDIPLQGAQALFNLSDSGKEKSPFEIDIVCKPSLLFLQDTNGDTTLVAIGRFGDMASTQLRADNLRSLYSYEQGFGGYSMLATLSLVDASRKEQERAYFDTLKKQLAEASVKKEQLSPPLQLLWEACKQTDSDFSHTCFDYLYLWHKQGGWLYAQEQPLSKSLCLPFEHIDWSSLSEKEWKGCAWSAALLKKLEAATSPQELIRSLERHEWPFLNEIKNHPQSGESDFILSSFTKHIYHAAYELPPISPHTLFTAEENAHLFSSYCRAYGIHLAAIAPTQSEPSQRRDLTLECPLSAHHKLLAPTMKMEENVPLLSLRLREKGRSELLTLAYEGQAQGLRWPVAEGKYLLRYQPLFTTLPYEVHLRRARQISYPQTNQPYSYESDLFITDKKTGERTKATISMNNVHETWDGYRFYLASMSPADESDVKRIQLAVNLDPAKYILTYPGALILSLGIVLLFWLRPTSKER